MSTREDSDFVVMRAATSMQYSPDTPCSTPQPAPSHVHTPHAVISATTSTSCANSNGHHGGRMGSGAMGRLGGGGGGGTFPSALVSPVKKLSSTTDGPDLASPPPRPPKRSTSHDEMVHDGGEGVHDQGERMEEDEEVSSDGLGHSHAQLLHLEPPAAADSTRRRLVAFDSEEAMSTATGATTLTTPSRTPPRETRTTRGPFSSMEASDSTSQALFSTTQLLNATTMPLARSEGSRDSESVFSPSVHRPVGRADGVDLSQRNPCRAGRHEDPNRGAGAAPQALLHGGQKRYESEDVWARDPSNGYGNDNDIANLTTATAVMPAAQSLRLEPAVQGGDSDRSSDGHSSQNHNTAAGAESDDEDEDGLFQETVLFMNNTIHSLGSTRRTPNKPPQTPLEQRGGSSPVPHMPAPSLDATPTKPAKPHRGGSDSDASDNCRPDREDAEACRVDRGIARPAMLPSEMNISTTTTGTQAYMTAPASPATTCSTRAPAPSSASPFLGMQLPRADFNTSATSADDLPPKTRAGAAAATGVAAEVAPAAARSAVPDREDSEYLFIDNHDGTAYLADASLQLDGSYALGQTILLARGSTAGSPIAGGQRRGRPSDTSLHGGDRAGYAEEGCGATSPVVVPQMADQLPQQREPHAHRPVRGTTLPEAATPGSPLPTCFHDSFASPVTPSVARVVVRRSAAPARDASHDDDARAAAAALSSSFLPPSFNGSFAFDQTLLVPLEDTLRSGHLGHRQGSGGVLSPSVGVDSRRGPQMSLRMQSAASSVRAASFRSAAPARCDIAASPLVIVPTSPAASFAVFQSRRASPSTRRSAAPSRASASLSASSRASPVPHAPSVGQQLASQQARAARDTRPSRPDQDIIYLVPPGAATTTMTPADITAQGWIPVQVVDVLPTPNKDRAPAQSGAGGGGSAGFGSPVYANNTYSGSGSPYVIYGGRTASPLPTDPQVNATGGNDQGSGHVAGAAADRGVRHNTGEADRMGNGWGEGEEEEEEAVREQSLSRLSHGRHDGVRNASFSLASTLSASTIDCINRRLSYSVSGWASARQRFGHSMSMGDRSSVSGIVMPPATPLTLTVSADGEGQGQEKEAREEGGARATVKTAQSMSLQHSRDRPRNLSLQLGSGGEGIAWAGLRSAGSPNAYGEEEDDDAAGSPVPLPPGTPETPQREQSPSRCTAMSTPVKTHQDVLSPTEAADAARVAATPAEGHMEDNSLLTSMSYQRPSTLTVSDEYTGDYSMSLPLTSSASQSIGLNGGVNANYHNRNLNAESFSMHHNPMQQLQYQQHQALRAPHPRRVSGATALSQGASSLSLQTFGEQSEYPSPGMSHNFASNTNNTSSSASNNNTSNTSNMNLAAATSFRTTYCNNRTSPGSVRAASLNPGANPTSNVVSAGLPLSRGNLGASVGGRGGHPHTTTNTTAGHNHTGAGPATTTTTTTNVAPQKLRYPQQYAAAAERRRANLPGAQAAHHAHATAHLHGNSWSSDSLAGRSGAVSRNIPQHHPYLSAQQQQHQQHARRNAAAAGAGVGGSRANPRRTNMARLVPDTSVFLPWAPLTITPEGSLNLGRPDKDGGDGGAAPAPAAAAATMNLVPFNSSLETSTVTTTTTTVTSGADGVSVAEMAQQLADNWANKESAELSPETLRTLNAAVAAMSRAANEGNGEAFLNEDGTVNKDAFVSSFLQHAASQAGTSVGDNSLNTTSMTTTTTTTTTTTQTLSGAGKSLAMSRASMTAGGFHVQDRSQRFDFQSMTTMEATLNQFQGSVSAVSAQEPEPRVPVPVNTAAQLRGVAAGAGKENGSAVRASASRKSESVGTARVGGLREGSPANAVRLSGKVSSPPPLTTNTATGTDVHSAVKHVA